MSIDEHPLRYTPLAQEIEKVLYRRALEKKLDGYTLDTALELATVAVDFHADPKLQPQR